MIFKSQQVNLDPEPWVGIRPLRHRVAAPPKRETYDTYHFDPRPELAPTRDPFPYAYVHPNGNLGARMQDPDGLTDKEWEWAPRREQFDTPVNRVLVTFRSAVRLAARAHGERGLEYAVEEYLWLIEQSGYDKYYTPDEIDHARKVLTRLASF